MAAILDFGSHFEQKMCSNCVNSIHIQLLTCVVKGVETNISIPDSIVQVLRVTTQNSLKMAAILDFCGHFDQKMCSYCVHFIFIQFLTCVIIGIETKISILHSILQELRVILQISLKTAAILDFGGHFELKMCSKCVHFTRIQFLTCAIMGIESKIFILDSIEQELRVIMRKNLEIGGHFGFLPPF